jgi:hypothetical protein
MTYQDMKICLLDIQSSDNISTYSNMWMCPDYRRLISPFPAITRKCDSLHFHPMPLFHFVNQTQSNANLAQRLLQVCCIILWSFLRLITSSNHIASIVTTIPVSTSQASLANQSGLIMRLCYAARCTLAMLDTILSRPRHWQGLGYAGRLRNLFFYGTATPAPGYPMHPVRVAPNAETPLPRKTRFLCNAYLYPPPIKTPFFSYTPDYATPCSYADPC